LFFGGIQDTTISFWDFLTFIIIQKLSNFLVNSEVLNFRKSFAPLYQDYEANKRDKESERPQGPNLGQQWTTSKEAFNYYVDQILPNFDHLPTSRGQLWKFYILPSSYPLFTWRCVDFIPGLYTDLFLST
jgi:hypothetical protein